MPTLYAAETASFDVGEQIGTVVSSITTSMNTVAEKAVGLIGDAAPLIIGIVAVGIILTFGTNLVRRIRG